METWVRQVYLLLCDVAGGDTRGGKQCQTQGRNRLFAVDFGTQPLHLERRVSVRKINNREVEAEDHIEALLTKCTMNHVL